MRSFWKNVRTLDASNLSLTIFTGVSICQIYNLDPQDLLWKWEALNFRTSNTRSEISPFTLDSVAALKETLRRNLAKEAAKKPQRATPMGQKAAINLTRTRQPAHAPKAQTSGPSQTGGVSIKVEQSVAGPSRVMFRGPKMDALSRKDRACECQKRSLYITYVTPSHR
jgi:DNA polymerase alpha subunit B